MDSREQFEAAMAAVLVAEGYKQESTPSILARNGREYQTIRIEGAWIGWQASREALVVELPKKYVIDGVPVVTVAELKIRLDKAGIKWK